MKMTRNQTDANSNPFDYLSTRLKNLFGEEAYQKDYADICEPFERFAFEANTEREMATMKIEAIYPAFNSIYADYPVFAKIWLINQTQSFTVPYSDVSAMIMDDSDRFMCMCMDDVDYMFWDATELQVKLIDGIPDNIHGIHRTIAKKIVKNRVTNEEANKLNGLLKKFKSDMSNFHRLQPYSTYTEAELEAKLPIWEGWRYVHEARLTGWFKMAAPLSNAEIEFCKNNNIFININNSNTPGGSISHQEEEINAGMARALEELMGKLDPNNAANTHNPEPANNGRNVNADIYVIDMNMIEGMADVVGTSINSAGGVDKILDKAFSNIDEDSAAFSMATIIKGIIAGGKKVVPNLIGILGPVIDLASGAFKKSVIREPEAMPVKIEQVMPKNIQIAIDESVDQIEGLANLLRGIITELCIIRDATDAQTQINAIDRIANLLKDNLKMFNDSKFVKLVDRFMGKLFDLADQAGISSDLAQEVVQNDEGVAAMLPPTVLPAGAAAHQQMVDDGTPYWMKAISEITSAMREQRGKMKPEFINQANHDAKAAAALPVPQTELDALTPNFKVDSALVKDYSWVNQICGIAVQHGLAVSATPFYNMKDDGSYEISSIRIESFVDGIPSKEKSFTIDLGHFLDRRIKMVFNYGVNGFGFMESCDDAYHVFDTNANGKPIIDTKIFNKIFSIGISSIKENEKRDMRMYNSNVTKVNRTIVWITVPTWACKGEDRKALKDSIFKMEKTIRAMSKINGFSFGRFVVYGFDPETMSYTLDNAGVYYKGQPTNAPHIIYNVTIGRNEDGTYKRDAEGRVEANCTMSYADNVFDINGPKFPDDATIICGSSEQNTDLFTTGVDPSDDGSTSVVVQVEGESEKAVPPVVIVEPENATDPAVVADPEKDTKKKTATQKGGRSKAKSGK